MKDENHLATVPASDVEEIWDRRRERPRPPFVVYRELVALRSYLYSLEVELSAAGEDREVDRLKEAWSTIHDATDRLERSHDLTPETMPPRPIMTHDLEGDEPEALAEGDEVLSDTEARRRDGGR